METTSLTSDGDLASKTPGARRLLVVDDHPVVQLGFRLLLSQQPWVRRCLQASTRDAALELTRQFEPHLALIDVILGDSSGLDLCSDLRRLSPATSVLLMSGAQPISAAVARAAGAIGFINKGHPPPALLGMIERALQDKYVFTARQPSAGAAKLTPRELDVLREIARGSSNPETARALHLSPHTIKQHLSSVYAKLHARNRTDAVRHAQRLGLIA